MKKTIKPSKLNTFIVICIITLLPLFAQESVPGKTVKMPKIVKFDTGSDAYQELLSGDKDSVVFYSGLVTIAPGGSGELHSTENYEEMIITLEGAGEVRVKEKKNLPISFGVVAYIPPESFHQVFNTGVIPLKYIYIATRSK